MAVALSMVCWMPLLKRPYDVAVDAEVCSATTVRITGFVILQPLYQIRYQQVVTLVAILLETFTFYWLYGTSVLFVDIQFMKKSPPKVIWKVWWNITPIIIAGLIYFHCTYSLNYLNQHLSNYQIRTSNVMLTLTMMIIPIGTLVQVVKHIRKEKMESLLKPTFTWGPPNPHLRAVRKKYKPSEEIRSQPFTYHQWRMELYTEDKMLHENPEDTQT
ncbi:uncharacterized protein LOC126176313 [Schistocerca cancellata]|uniref:uncharacterized protein LOC126176313 n=1 Tax=Schistocerca cancellata TaxID=274614 RepID=UPI0021182BC2|nr:uncharacterized protein LOC126176313 [Schistocerca cancellata]